MSPDQPRLSIALPVRNGEHHLADAIESHLAQTFRDFELHIYDNASADGTEEIGRGFAATDGRVHYHRRDRMLSGSQNFNRAFDAAATPLFKWSAHDDLLAPEYLERCVAALDARPDAILCHTGIATVDDRGVPIREQLGALRHTDSADPEIRFREVLLRQHGCLPVYGVMRREVLGRTQRLGAFLGADRILLAELALAGPMLILPEPLFVLRDHSGRSTRRHPGRERSEWFDLESTSRVLWPKWRRLREYHDTIQRALLSPEERQGCRRALMAWSWRERTGLTRNLASGLLSLAGLRDWAVRRRSAREA